jgi:hypothetical protein
MRVLGRRGVVLAVAVAVVLLLASAPAAGAGTYTVETCTNGSLSGWSHFNVGAWSMWATDCGIAGGGLHSSISVTAGSTSGWTFTAPADTELSAFKLTRSYALPANQPYGTGVVLARTDGPGSGYSDWWPNFGGAIQVGPDVVERSALRGQQSLTTYLECGGGSECTGGSRMVIHGAAFELRDDLSPTVQTSGSLLAGGELKGTRAIAYSAADRGGGIRRERLTVDGEPRGERWLDCSFALVVPCPLTTSGSFALDTTRLGDGDHEVDLTVWDATLTNLARHSFRITVDNVPAPVATTNPRIYGTAARGVTLYADDGIWSGAGLTLTRRWQRHEDGSWEDIAGATGPAYTPTDDDAGHKLRFRVRAGNNEGTTDAYSAATAVIPAPPNPTATPTPTPSPTPSPPAAVLPGAPVTVGSAPQPTAPVEPVALASVAAAFASTGQGTITLRWGERRKVTGTLTRADGRPVAGARLTVTSRNRTLNARTITLGDVTTDASGRFTYLPAAGVSRSVTFTLQGRSASVSIRVVPRVTLHYTRTGQISGRVSGAPLGVRRRVDLQTPRNGAWRTFATTRLRPTGGTFHLTTHTHPKRIRAVIRADPTWPFVTHTTPAVTRPH